MLTQFPKEKNMSQEFSNVAEQPKKNNTVLIIVAVVAALLCCCCLLVVAGYALTGPAISNTFENIQEDLNEMPYEGMPDSEDTPYSEATPSGDDGFGSGDYGLSDYIPNGGLGDDTLRTDTWFYINLSAAVQSCVIPATGAQNTTIEVTQDPDSSGAWSERWTVPCEDGTTKAFAVSFTPAAGGGTDISVSLDE
jgi:hypothetical protein